MNILYLQNSSPYHPFILSALKALGKKPSILHIPDSDAGLLQGFSSILGQSIVQKVSTNPPDFLFSVEFYPTLSSLCEKLQLPYLSWNLSGNYEALFSPEARNSCNRCFLFDYEMAVFFQKHGLEHIFYLPFGTEISRRREAYSTDVTVIARLYPELEQDAFAKAKLLDSTYGYTEGLIAAQRIVYGFDFFQEIVPEYILRDLEKNCPPDDSANPMMGLRAYYAERFFHPRVTRAERSVAVRVLAQAHPSVLYTEDTNFAADGLENRGLCPASALTGVIQQSRINCQITHRKIRSGISPSAWQIIGSGGFLVTDYRQEFYEWFVPGEDCVVCESLEDMLEKCSYYLLHEAEREKMALRCQEKAAAGHTWRHRMQTLLQIAGKETLTKNTDKNRR